MLQIATKGIGSSSTAPAPPPPVGNEIGSVFPLTTPSIFDNDTGITNQSAVWSVLSEEPLDGSFQYYPGGGFLYTAGTQTGTASFVYQINNFDGLGTNTQATVTVVVS